ncbi:prepilin peptidase [Candidatus Micrarchaeota archaeon]|nr:prepilin peptidase [Candidatus Micrarchaeota archaeon]
MDYAIFALAAFFCAIISIIDLRTRIIHPAVNYSFFALAIGLAFYKNVFSLNYALFTAAAFAFAYLLYKLGAWAGGDAKFYAALLAYLPLLIPKYGFEHILYAFLASALLLIPVTLIIFSREVLALKKQVIQNANLNAGKLSSSALISAALVYAYSIMPNYLLLLLAALALALYQIPLLLSIPVFAIAAYLNPQLAIPSAIALLAISAFSRILLSAFSLARAQVLRRKLLISQVKPGDIPAQTLVEKDGELLAWSPPSATQLYQAVLKSPLLALALLRPPQGIVLADSSKARGLTENELRELKKRKQVTFLWVKQSTPFAPVLSAGFLVLALAASLA